MSQEISCSFCAQRGAAEALHADGDTVMKEEQSRHVLYFKDTKLTCDKLTSRR